MFDFDFDDRDDGHDNVCLFFYDLNLATTMAMVVMMMRMKRSTVDVIAMATTMEEPTDGCRFCCFFVDSRVMMMVVEVQLLPAMAFLSFE